MLSIDAFCTLATVECVDELSLFLVSLRYYHPATPIFVATTTPLLHLLASSRPIGRSTASSSSLSDDHPRARRLQELSRLYQHDKNIHWIPSLDPYLVECSFRDQGHGSATLTSSSSLNVSPSFLPQSIDRRKMEQTRGVYFGTRHEDFMMEKAQIMDLAMRRCSLSSTGMTSAGDAQQNRLPFVLFLDCDVCTCAAWALPAADERQPTSSVILESSSKDDKAKGATASIHSSSSSSSLIAVSPHRIRKADERLWGRYNGGCFGTNDPMALFSWKKHTETSRFFDQASIEDVVRDWGGVGGGGDPLSAPSHSSPANGLFPQRRRVLEFPVQVNFGYWRLFQSETLTSPALALRSNPLSGQMGIVRTNEMSRFSISQQDGQRLLLYDGAPLQSVHTHFFLPESHFGKPSSPGSGDRCMPLFNAFVKGLLRASSPTYQHLLRLL